MFNVSVVNNKTGNIVLTKLNITFSETMDLLAHYVDGHTISITKG